MIGILLIIIPLVNNLKNDMIMQVFVGLLKKNDCSSCVMFCKKWSCFNIIKPFIVQIPNG
jgi:hypothetical protein